MKNFGVGFADGLKLHTQLQIQNEYIYITFLIYILPLNNTIIISRSDIMVKSIIKINKKGEDGYKVISVRIKDGVLQKIDNVSIQSNRSRNEIINILLETSVDAVEIN